MAEVRPLTLGERAALVRMADKLPDAEREGFLRDIENCGVSSQTEDDSRLLFELRGYVRPEYKGQHAYPVEGVVKDADGAELTVCVYADHQDRLLELEVIKWGDASIQQPDWDTFEVRY